MRTSITPGRQTAQIASVQVAFHLGFYPIYFYGLDNCLISVALRSAASLLKLLRREPVSGNCERLCCFKWYMYLSTRNWSGTILPHVASSSCCGSVSPQLHTAVLWCVGDLWVESGLPTHLTLEPHQLPVLSFSSVFELWTVETLNKR